MNKSAVIRNTGYVQYNSKIDSVIQFLYNSSINKKIIE